MSDLYNPDYPVSNAGSFSQHLYQPEQNNGSAFYYPGYGYNSFNQYSFASNVSPDSRRNDGMNMSMPQIPAQNPATYTGERGVLPFSSYPVQNVPPQNGFNSLVESRRYDNTPTNVGNNPWASTPTSTPAPMPQYTPMTPPMQPTPSAWSYPTVPYNPYYSDPNCAALYTEQQFGFDKTNGAWNNMYNEPRQIAPPNINWNQVREQQQYQYQQPPMYPAFNNSQIPMSWKDMADKNWGNGGI